jgi:hypothetical protein
MLPNQAGFGRFIGIADAFLDMSVEVDVSTTSPTSERAQDVPIGGQNDKQRKPASHSQAAAAS